MGYKGKDADRGVGSHAGSADRYHGIQPALHENGDAGHRPRRFLPRQRCPGSAKIQISRSGSRIARRRGASAENQGNEPGRTGGRARPHPPVDLRYGQSRRVVCIRLPRPRYRFLLGRRGAKGYSQHVRQQPRRLFSRCCRSRRFRNASDHRDTGCLK